MRLGLVLAGGAARGAYQVGVIQYLIQAVGPELGRMPWEVICGSSAGAIHASMLAALADEPGEALRRLVRRWRSFRVEEMLGVRVPALFEALARLLGRNPRPGRATHSGLLSIRGLKELQERVPFERIGAQLAAGTLAGLSISATHIASGRTVVFVQRRDRTTPLTTTDPTSTLTEVEISPEHVLASASIPLLFPAVRIGEDYFCDGSLRQNVPLSPARHLGAEALIVISPHRLPHPVSSEEVRAHEAAYSDPLFLAGKAFDALLLDRVDADVAELERTNAMLEAGTRRFGPGFVAGLNAALGSSPGDPVRVIRACVVRPSQGLGEIALEVARSPGFRRRASGLTGRALMRLSDETGDGADLLSYLLFDGEYAEQLMALGWSDARRRRDELLAIARAPPPPPAEDAELRG